MSRYRINILWKSVFLIIFAQIISNPINNKLQLTNFLSNACITREKRDLIEEKNDIYNFKALIVTNYEIRPTPILEKHLKRWGLPYEILDIAMQEIDIFFNETRKKYSHIIIIDPLFLSKEQWNTIISLDSRPKIITSGPLQDNIATTLLGHTPDFSFQNLKLQCYHLKSSNWNYYNIFPDLKDKPLFVSSKRMVYFCLDIFEWIERGCFLRGSCLLKEQLFNDQAYLTVKSPRSIAFRMPEDLGSAEKYYHEVGIYFHGANEEISIKETEEMADFIRKFKLHVTAPIVMNFVEEDGSLIQLDHKFPKQTAILKKLFKEGLLYPTFHGYTHMLLNRFDSSSLEERKKYNIYTDFFDINYQQNIDYKSQYTKFEKGFKQLNDIFGSTKQSKTFIAPGYAYDENTLKIAKKFGMSPDMRRTQFGDEFIRARCTLNTSYNIKSSSMMQYLSMRYPIVIVIHSYNINHKEILFWDYALSQIKEYFTDIKFDFMVDQRNYEKFLEQVDIQSLHYPKQNKLKLILKSKYPKTMSNVLISGKIPQTCYIKRVSVNDEEIESYKENNCIVEFNINVFQNQEYKIIIEYKQLMEY